MDKMEEVNNFMVEIEKNVRQKQEEIQGEMGKNLRKTETTNDKIKEDLSHFKQLVENSLNDVNFSKQ